MSFALSLLLAQSASVPSQPAGPQVPEQRTALLRPALPAPD